MESETWPSELQAVKENLHRTTQLYMELVDNRGNEYDIIPGLLQAFRRNFPQAAEQKERKFMELKIFEGEAAPPAPSTDPLPSSTPGLAMLTQACKEVVPPALPCTPSCPSTGTDVDHPEAVIGAASAAECGGLTEPTKLDVQIDSTEAVCILNDLGIQAHCMYLQESENERIESFKRAEMILT